MDHKTKAGSALSRMMREKKWVIFGPNCIRFMKRRAAHAERKQAKNALLVRLFYECPNCGEIWDLVWECDKDETCPNCGHKDVVSTGMEEYL